MEPLLSGRSAQQADASYDDDVRYAVDLGLVTVAPDVMVANPMYREIIVRERQGAAAGQAR